MNNSFACDDTHDSGPRREMTFTRLGHAFISVLSFFGGPWTFAYLAGNGMTPKQNMKRKRTS